MEAEADLERVLVIDDRDTPLTLADERIARAIRENNARLVIIDPVQAFMGADVDMNRARRIRCHTGLRQPLGCRYIAVRIRFRAACCLNEGQTHPLPVEANESRGMAMDRTSQTKPIPPLRGNH